ncbi:MAG: hypothetical protein FWD57_05740, partial [Polyangiaceae bacterium]|nr:hypothetical protein [Polyangiaceae bacterium]
MRDSNVSDVSGVSGVSGVSDASDVGLILESGGSKLLNSRLLACDPPTERGGHMSLTPDWLRRLMTGVGSVDGVEPLPQVSGPTARLSRWRARAIDARLRGDRNADRDACWKLATHLADSGQGLADAMLWAKRAIYLSQDDAWRVQYSTWLDQLGFHREAASVLAPCVTRAPEAREAARLLTRMARLQIRAGDYQLATQNLLEAATAWPAGTESLEIAGEIAVGHGLQDASTMLLEAADRHEQNGNPGRCFDLRRKAFEAAPSNAQACSALASTLEQSDRFHAADGVRFRHACASRAASDPLISQAVHVARVVRANEIGDHACALAAVVQGRLETATSESHSSDVDHAFVGMGLHDAVAARWEWNTSMCEGPHRARVFMKLAGLYLGPLASPDRAVDAWIEAVAADPGCVEALSSLRSHARSTRDATAWMEALVRAVILHPNKPAATQCLREILASTEDRASEPSLAYWALSELMKRGPEDPALERTRAALGPRVKLQDTAIAAARDMIAQDDAAAKLGGWRRLAAILRERPHDIDEYLDVLQHLICAGQNEQRWWQDFERAATRARRPDLLEALARDRLAAGSASADTLHLRTILIAQAWRRNDPTAALEHAWALAEEVPDARAACANAFIAASATSNNERRIICLQKMSAHLSGSARGSLLSIAGLEWLALGDDGQARAIANAVRNCDDSDPQVLRFLGSLTGLVEAPDVARTLEGYAAVYLPMTEHHGAIVDALTSSGDHELAHAWAKRWFDIRPWDADVARRLIDLSSATTTDAQVSALRRVAASSLPLLDVETAICRAIVHISQLDLVRASQVAIELAGVYGVSSSELRECVLSILARVKNTRAEAQILERWVSHPDAPIDAVLRLSELYQLIDEPEAESMALLRATRCGVVNARVLERVKHLQTTTSGDVAVHTFEAEARAHALVGAVDESRRAWMVRGSTLWYRAADTVGAVDSWSRALGADAVSFARLSDALAVGMSGETSSVALREFANACEDPVRRASALVVAAARAIASNRTDTATDLALEALHLDPRRTDALVIVEHATEGSASVEVLRQAHALAAAGAKGRFGRCAAHLRAARILEARGHVAASLAHAI